MEKLRQEFEEWYVYTNELRLNTKRYDLDRHEDGYVYGSADTAWKAWQAAHAMYSTKDKEH